jgi:membrane protein implicated in regulation of membrane protease activity
VVVTMLRRLEKRLNEVPEDLRQGPVMFAAAALIGPFVIVLFALFLGPTASTPVLTVAATVFVLAVAGFAWTTYRRFKEQQAENLRREAARTRRRVSRRRPVSDGGGVAAAPVIDEERERRAS